MTDRERAIEIIRDSRESHVAWKRYIEEHPDEAKKRRPEVETAGDAAFHQECIEGYDLVLKVLEAAG